MDVRAACLWSALVIGLQGSTVQLPPADGKGSTAPRYLGFIIAPGRCDAGATDCELRKPKPWTAGEIDTLKGAIDEIVARPMGKLIIDRAQRRGFLTLERYAFAGINPESGAPYPPPGPTAALRPYLYTIDIYDPYFAKPRRRDPFSGKPGYLDAARLLLHECFHAVDNLSRTDEFRKLAGFMRAGSAFTFAAGNEADVHALTEFAKYFNSLESPGDWERLWRANRSLALGMKPVRVPTMGSIRSPAEAFAEIGSHLILDPRARTYLPRETVAYFDERVLR